jgi:hypothetical protein
VGQFPPAARDGWPAQDAIPGCWCRTSAALVASGAVLSFFTIRDDVLSAAPAAARPECTVSCAVGAPPLEPGSEDAARPAGAPEVA